MKMEGLEQGQEKIKGDIDKLKGAMSKMMDMLQTLNVKESQHHQKVIFHIAGLTIEPHPTQIMNISWKEYNFLPSYNLPIANAYGVGSFNQHVV